MASYGNCKITWVVCTILCKIIAAAATIKQMTISNVKKDVGFLVVRHLLLSVSSVFPISHKRRRGGFIDIINFLLKSHFLHRPVLDRKNRTRHTFWSLYEILWPDQHLKCQKCGSSETWKNSSLNMWVKVAASSRLFTFPITLFHCKYQDIITNFRTELASHSQQEFT